MNTVLNEYRLAYRNGVDPADSRAVAARNRLRDISCIILEWHENEQEGKVQFAGPLSALYPKLLSYQEFFVVRHAAPER